MTRKMPWRNRRSTRPNRRLWLRMHPDRPVAKAYPFKNEVVCPICGKIMNYYNRLGDNRRRLNELCRTNRANLERHIDACFEKQLQKSGASDADSTRRTKQPKEQESAGE